MRVIRAHDRMQQAFEKEVGRSELAEALKVIHALERLAQS
jgi:hypothetical protein